MLEQEKQHYEKIKGSLLETSAGQIAVIHGQELIGVYPTLEEAYGEAAKRVGLVPFLVRTIGEQEQAVSIPALALGILSANNTPSARR